VDALIVDTSALYEFFNASGRDHASVVAAVDAHNGPLVLSPYVLAELDYLVSTRLGVDAELALLDQVASGVFELPITPASDVAAMRDVVARYNDQQIGLADASLVVLAAQYRTRRVLTLDRRHFMVLRSLAGEPFTLLP
jgi:uncharacterized protein